MRAIEWTVQSFSVSGWRTDDRTHGATRSFADWTCGASRRSNARCLDGWMHGALPIGRAEISCMHVRSFAVLRDLGRIRFSVFAMTFFCNIQGCLGVFKEDKCERKDSIYGQLEFYSRCSVSSRHMLWKCPENGWTRTFPCVAVSVRPTVRPLDRPSVRPSFRTFNRPSVRPSVRPSDRLPYFRGKSMTVVLTGMSFACVSPFVGSFRFL